MNKEKFKSAYILAVCAAVALSATIMNSCSSDDDYDIYQGDELKTYAATTRAVGESGGTKVYSYSFKANDSRTAIATISAADDFTASVTFSWIGGSDAKSAKINVSCKFSNPTKFYKTAEGNYVERPLYTNTDYRYTAVLPNIGEANVYSSLSTDLVVNYTEISYDQYGNKTGSVTRPYNALVTVNVTDCIDAKFIIIQ